MQELMTPMLLWQQQKLRPRKLHKVALQPLQARIPLCSCVIWYLDAQQP